MSYIDTFDHEFVGFFGNRPVYHPLETVQVNDIEERDFNCNPSQLVIGGGSGEYPAIVVKRLDCAVVKFYSAWTLWLDDKKIDGFDEEQWDEKFDPCLTIDLKAMLHFAGWYTHEYFEFYQYATSPAFYTPLKKKEGLEHWLLESVGEFIFFSMPELVPQLKDDISKLRKYINIALFKNILLPPPNYPLPLGRKIIDGQLVWGNRWWKNNTIG